MMTILLIILVLVLLGGGGGTGYGRYGDAGHRGPLGLVIGRPPDPSGCRPARNRGQHAELTASLTPPAARPS